MRTLSESELIALDRREFALSVTQEIERIESQPVDLSIILNGIHVGESKLRYLARLLEVATPEQKPILEAEIARYEALLTRHKAELAAREEALTVETGPLEPVDLDATPAARNFDDREAMAVAQIPVTAEVRSSETSPPTAPRSRRGRPGRPEAHARVADMVAEIGDDWKSDVNLRRLAEWMDSGNLQVDKRWRQTFADTWADKLDLEPGNFVKAIEYRLKQAKK